MGIAKDTINEIEVTKVPNQPNQNSFVSKDSIVHPELYRYFGIDPKTNTDTKINQQLKDISNWALSDNSNTGEMLKKIWSLESKVGQPALKETRINKLHNYIRMEGHIKSLTSNMSNQLSGITNRAKQQLGDIKNNYESKIDRLSDEIKKAERDYKIALNNHNLNANVQSKNIKDRYYKQLTELKTMRNIYRS